MYHVCSLIFLSFLTDPGLDPGEERESILNKISFYHNVLCFFWIPAHRFAVSGMTGEQPHDL